MRKFEFILARDEGKCVNCGACAKLCQFGALVHDKRAKETVYERRRCFGCGLCIQACEQGALSLTARETVEERENCGSYDKDLLRELSGAFGVWEMHACLPEDGILHLHFKAREG